tara:strand:- start:36236 stop:36355 length:120 start_codon:yes stop_codon:yes gene_type:complete
MIESRIYFEFIKARVLFPSYTRFKEKFKEIVVLRQLWST